MFNILLGFSLFGCSLNDVHVLILKVILLKVIFVNLYWRGVPCSEGLYIEEVEPEIPYRKTLAEYCGAVVDTRILRPKTTEVHLKFNGTGTGGFSIFYEKREITGRFKMSMKTATVKTFILSDV